MPPSLARALPPGAAVTSRAALTAAALADPLSAAPQQALLAMAVAAALLAITGFWVSIAADVRQRRAENALLAALGVTQRSAAAQPVPGEAVALGSLGRARPGARPRRRAAARARGHAYRDRAAPGAAADTLFDLSQTIPLAAAVAVLPALAAALVVFRRPDPAAELRAAEAA